MKNRLFEDITIRRCYVCNTFIDIIIKLRNTNHVTEINWKFHVVRRVKWYEDNRLGIKMIMYNKLLDV